MDEYHFHHLPVVDDGRVLVGIVSDLDVRRGVQRGLATVGDAMTKSPATITQAAVPGEALRAMLSGKFHSVPVLDGPRLVGMITSTDFLREFSYGAAGSDEPCSRHMLGDETHVEGSASLAEARNAMDDLEVDCLAVLKGELPIGVLTRRTLTVWTEFSQPQGSSRVKAIQLATTNVPVLRPADTLQEAARQMLDRGVQAVVIADRANRYSGLLTDQIILSVMAERFV
jgi:CBS domain-containing protein